MAAAPATATAEERHAPWDCKDWECKQHVNKGSHGLWPPPSTPEDMMRAQRRLAAHLEELWWVAFGVARPSDTGEWYSPGMRQAAASRRLYKQLMEMLKQPLPAVADEPRD